MQANHPRLVMRDVETAAPSTASCAAVRRLMPTAFAREWPLQTVPGGVTPHLDFI